MSDKSVVVMEGGEAVHKRRRQLSDGSYADVVTVGGSAWDSSRGVSGVKQVEMATVVGDITTGGTVRTTVTASGLAGSPLDVDTTVIAGDTAIVVAGKIRTKLGITAAVTALMDVGGTSAEVKLTRNAALANDTSMNIAYAVVGPCAGLTDDPSSADTTAGVIGGPVTSADMSSTAVAVTDAPTSSEFLVIEEVTVSSANAELFTFTCETTLAVIAYVRTAANGTTTVRFESPIKLETADKKLFCKASASGAVEINVAYHSEA
jgi:hypothetical protein